MSEILTKWSVVQEETVASGDYDSAGVVRTDVVSGWIDAACRAYLDQCPVLDGIRVEGALDLCCDHDDLPARVFPGRPESFVVSATATEIWPDAFAVAVRIRPLDGDAARPLDVVCRVRLCDTDGASIELGNGVRDELIALEHAARHYN